MGRKVRDLVLFLLVTAAAIVLTLFVGQSAQMGILIYNFAFLGVMVLLYLFGLFGGMFRMNTIADAISNATEELIGIFKTSGKVSEDKLKHLNGIFSHRYLDTKINNFTESIAKSEEGIGEIEEYLNEDELDLHIHKRLVEMIPDIMTSLGILGTFVGLVWGLKNFNPANYEAMTTSVSSLVDGIKVAFLTSIYGISFSIIYTYGIKSAYSAMTEKLQAFLERFHAYVIPTAENESRNLLVATQKRQAEAMSEMAEQFSVQMAESFEKVITPTFRKMNNSLDVLVNTVTNVQEDAIRAILNEFLREMNSSFKVQFRDFNDSLAELRDVQKENVAYTAELYKNFTGELTDNYMKQERLMRSSVNDMNKLQTQFISTANRIISDNQTIQKQQQVDYEHVVEYLQEAERTSAKFWVACNQAMQKYVESAAAAVDKIGTANKSTEETMKTNKRLVDELGVQIEKFNEYQRMSYQTMDQVKRLLSDIVVAKEKNDITLRGGANASMDLKKLEALLESQGERQEELLSQMNKSFSNLAKNSQKGKFGLFK